jgi:hypothetical protein
VSANKTTELEEIQKEIELVKAKIWSKRKHVLESNRISKDTIQMKNREVTENFIA